MRLIGWLCVVSSPLSLTIGILFSRENRRVYDVLCGQGRLWACAKDATGPAITGALIALGLLVFGILILAIRRPQRRRRRNAYDPDDEQMRRIRRDLARGPHRT